MRRKDRENDDEGFINQALDDAETIFLALMDGEYPYCLPFNFVRMGRRLFIHSAFDGHKIDLIRKNPHAAFAAALDVKIDRAGSTTYFRSVAGRGRALIVEDELEKRRALDALAEKYRAACPRPCPPETAARVQIIGVDIIEAHGKLSAQRKN